MIGDVAALELQIGHGHVVYTGGAKGTDELVEELGKQFGMQVEVLVPPHHPRATFITPSTVEVLMLANPHLHQAAEKLGKRMPSHFYTLQLLQRNYQIAKKAHTIYAFGILEPDHKRVKGGVGPCNWPWIKANPSISLTFPVKRGTTRTITTKSMRMPPPWSQAVNLFLGDLKSRPFIKAVLSWDPGMWTRKPEPKFKPYSTAPSVSPRTLINYVWNWKTFICNFFYFLFLEMYIAFFSILLVFIFQIVYIFQFLFFQTVDSFSNL